MKNPETRVCLVRHGETDWNAARRIQGSRDIDLNDSGRRQALCVAKSLVAAGISALYSSDLLRAWNTASAIGQVLGLTTRPAPQMRERNYGFFEGLTYAEAQALHPAAYVRHQARDPEFDYETGETLRTMYQRVSGKLETLAAAHSGETVAIVVHGGVLDIVHRHVCRTPLEARRDFEIPNAGINWLRRDESGWQIENWAQTEHLQAEALDELPT